MRRPYPRGALWLSVCLAIPCLGRTQDAPKKISDPSADTIIQKKKAASLDDGGSADVSSKPGADDQGPSADGAPGSATKPGAASAPPTDDAGIGAQRNSDALNAASGLAQGMMNSLGPADAGAGGPPGGAGARAPSSGRGNAGGGSPATGAPGGGTAARGGAAPPAAAARAPADFANPQTTSELALASVAGFGGAFADMGLKVGRTAEGSPAILRQDGAPASPKEIAGLSARIAASPLALMQRPDFFKVIAPEKYNALKTDYQTHPEMSADEFKHIGLTTAQRDFVRSESCGQVSGACNRYTKQSSYKKGEYVPPEDLNSIWAKIREETQGTADAAGARDARAFRAREDRSSSLADKMRSILARFSGAFGDGASGPAPDSEAAPGPGPGGAAPAPGGGARATAALSSSARRTAADPPPSMSRAAAPPAGPSRGALLALAAAGLTGGSGFWLARRRRRASTEDVTDAR